MNFRFMALALLAATASVASAHVFMPVPVQNGTSARSSAPSAPWTVVPSTVAAPSVRNALASDAPRSPVPIPLTNGLATSVSQVAGDEQALRILASVGAAIAKEQSIPASNSLVDLNAAMNAGLQSLDWGQVEIYEAEKALEFVVIGYPCFEGVDAQTAFAAILEALLEGWLTQQAARPGLSMRLAERGSGSYPPLVFRYERSGV